MWLCILDVICLLSETLGEAYKKDGERTAAVGGLIEGN